MTSHVLSSHFDFDMENCLIVGHSMAAIRDKEETYMSYNLSFVYSLFFSDLPE